MRLKGMTKKLALKFAVPVLAVMLILPLVLVGCSSKTDDDSDIYVKLINDGKKIEMAAPVSDDKRDVFLFAIDRWQTASDIASMKPIADAKVKNGDGKASFKTESYNIYEMLCKGYLFGMISSDGKYYEPVSDTFYITNSVELNDNWKDVDLYSPDGDIKGLVGSPAQLMDLGAKKTVITVDIGKLLSGTGGAGKISVIWNGVTCHIDRNELEALDIEVKSFEAAGVKVGLELVLKTKPEELHEELKCIAFETATDASGYAFNMTNRGGATKISALLNFISERYSGNGNGKVEALIIGKRVNDMAQYYASGLKSEEAVKNYLSAVRTAYNLFLAYNPNGRVYIALGNNWRAAQNGGLNANEFLTTFTNLAENGGDFFWQVGLEANASDASSSAIWKDELSSVDPRFISPANLENITDVLATSAYLYKGMQRNLLLTNFRIGGREADKQAASYAYAFYKCLDAKNVDGLIYGQAVDYEDDTLNAGLYSNDGVNIPELKKIGEVFESVDNVKTVDVAYISGILGGTWNDLYDKHVDSAIRRHVTRESATANHSKEEISVLADFSGGSKCNFLRLSSEYTELRYSDAWSRPVLYTALSPAFAGDGSGVISKSIDFKSVKDAGYLTVTAKVDSVGDNIAMTVTIAGYDKDGVEHVYKATNEVRTGEWVEMYYDIGDFVEHVESDTISLAVTVQSTGADSEPTGLWISKVSAEAPDHKPFPWWIVWIAVGVAAAGGITAFIIWFRKNYTFVRE